MSPHLLYSSRLAFPVPLSSRDTKRGPGTSFAGHPQLIITRIRRRRRRRVIHILIVLIILKLRIILIIVVIIIPRLGGSTQEPVAANLHAWQASPLDAYAPSLGC